MRAGAAARAGPPLTWSCIASVHPTAARSHQRAEYRVQASTAPRSASAAPSGTGFGFQMNVEPSTRAGDAAASTPATCPVQGPPTA